MPRLSNSLSFILLISLLRVERILSDIQHGCRTKMIKLYYLVMDSRHNPLSNIPDTTTRHLVMQMLAWMWCIVFSMWVGSIVVFGVSATVHAILLAGVFVTVSVFETAKRHPAHYGGLGRANGGEHE